MIFVLAIFANFVVRNGLVDPDDARATLDNIAGSETLFRFGLVAFLAAGLQHVRPSWLRPLPPFAVDALRPTAESRGLRFEVSAPPGPVARRQPADPAARRI